jgi:hypothetical protein
VLNLGFGHPLPIPLAVVGVVDLIALPFLIVAYVREALGPHEASKDA